jgi:hypothetical protein
VIQIVVDSRHWWYRESRTPHIGNTGSWQLPVLVSRSQKSEFRWYRELTTPRVGEMVSHRLSVLMSLLLLTSVTVIVTPRIGDKGSRQLPRICVAESCWLPLSVTRGVGDSAYRWYGELTTPRIGDTVSHQLSVLMSLLLLTPVTVDVTDTGSRQLWLWIPLKIRLHHLTQFKSRRIGIAPSNPPLVMWWENNRNGLKILSSQKRGGYRGVSVDSFRLPTPSLIFFLNT